MQDTVQTSNARPLSGPDMPADNGLTALGMLMQLGGHVFLALMAFFTSVLLVTSRGAGDGVGVMLLVGVAGIVRSGLHRSAGAALVNAANDSTGRDPWRLTRIYVGVALAQTALAVVVMKSELHLSGAALAQMALALVAWPITLLVVTRMARFRRFGQGIPMPEDRGFEGAGIIMLLFGILGSMFAVIVIAAMLGAGPILQLWQGWLMLLIVALLGIRSLVHLGAGIGAVTGANPARFSQRAVSYVNWGIGTAAIAGGGLFLLMASGEADGAFLAIIGVFIYLLLAWPLVVKMVVVNRDVPIVSDGTDEPWGRAPDLGMTALGWLMLVFAVLGLASAVPLLFSEPMSPFGRGGNPLENLLGSGILGGDLAARMGRSNWFSVAIAALQLWAAIELITLSQRWKLATITYGVGAALISVYVSLPMFEQIGVMFDQILRGGHVRIVVLGQVAMSLVIPIGAILLANRAGTAAPTARARLRDRG